MRRILLVMLVTTACRGAGGSAETRLSDDLTEGQPQVLISTADGLIGGVSDLKMDPDGTLYVVDRQSSQIHVVDGNGRVTSLGRPGAGPGEFSQPTTVQKRGDTLLVVDWGNGRLQGLSALGAPLFTRSLPPGQAPSIGADARFVRPIWGTDTMLAVIHLSDLSVVAPIGRTVGTPTNVVNPRRMKREIQEGRVPEIFLNTAEAVIALDSAAWLYVPARGSVQRFDGEGREVFSLVLDEPERVDLFGTFISENVAKPGASFAPLRYIADATLVGDDLWVLLGNSLGGAAAVRVIHPDGALGQRIEFPTVVGASQVAVDATRGLAYFLKADMAELVRVTLSGSGGE